MTYKSKTDGIIIPGHKKAKSRIIDGTNSCLTFEKAAYSSDGKIALTNISISLSINFIGT